MINLKDLTPEQLRHVIAIREKIESLQAQIESISSGGNDGAENERAVGPSKSPAGQAAASSDSFWESPSSDEYARRQGAKPITDIRSLYGNGEPDDWRGFDEAVERWHAENPVT